MEFTVNTDVFLDAIIYDEEKQKFREWLGGKEFAGGMRVKPYDRWTRKQQGKIWRDLEGVAKLLHIDPDILYQKLKNGDRFQHMFTEKREYIWHGKPREELFEKGLSKWSKEDCKSNIDELLAFFEEVIQNEYQQVIIFNWSSRDNYENKRPMFEFTDQPYYGANI